MEVLLPGARCLLLCSARAQRCPLSPPPPATPPAGCRCPTRTAGRRRRRWRCWRRLRVGVPCCWPCCWPCCRPCCRPCRRPLWEAAKPPPPALAPRPSTQQPGLPLRAGLTAAVRRTPRSVRRELGPGGGARGQQDAAGVRHALPAGVGRGKGAAGAGSHCLQRVCNGPLAVFKLAAGFCCWPHPSPLPWRCMRLRVSLQLLPNQQAAVLGVAPPADPPGRRSASS
jgi:hypothetical protein